MLLIKNGRVLDPASGLDQKLDVLINEGRILAMSAKIEEPAAQVIDATGLVLAPGLVDIHVHFREPGQTHKEDIHTGALAAAAGGFTSVVMMANTQPTISTRATLEAVLASARKEPINIYTNASVTHNFDGQTLTDFATLKQAGAVSFSDDGMPLTDAGLLRDALKAAKACGTFVAVHEEDPTLNGVLGLNEHIAVQHFHCQGATAMAEYSMVARDVMIAYGSQAHLHIQHLSTAQAVKLVAFAQELGAQVTAEATPQHFSKTEDLLLMAGANAKMNPPLRTEADRLAVIEGLKANTISIIATDHAPHHREEKQVTDICQAPSGMTGLETALSLGLTALVEPGHLTLSDLLAKMTINPARLYQFDAGYLQVGGPADVLIFDPDADRIVSSTFASKAANSPFIGERLKGKVHYTICRGQIVFEA
ncbi:dihydroorotase [Streptococcus halichoeri]|uniref:dihydroorotase n=1 Tax=Streptococcus halichoeri TaxID=254785 RepID=UPI00135B550A|nr:dihydroorotase [Streptococcus halichoeri]